MVADAGVADDRRIVAAAWLQDSLDGDADSRDAFAQDQHSADMPALTTATSGGCRPAGKFCLDSESTASSCSSTGVLAP
jgi:hypothetical protein